MRRAGLSGVTFHSLRHFYASLLIRHGESVRTVQAQLGNASAAETLDTYSHLWPDSDDRTRAVVDSAMRGSATTCGLSTPSDHLPAARRGVTDESACTPGTVKRTKDERLPRWTEALSWMDIAG